MILVNLIKWQVRFTYPSETHTLVRKPLRSTLSHYSRYATWTVVRHELKCDKKDRFRVDSEGRELIQEGFVMGLRLSGESAECEGNSPAVRIQTRDKRKSRHVWNRDFSHSPRQIAIINVFRAKSRISQVLATNRDFFSFPRQIAHFPLNLRTKFAHFPLNLKTKCHVFYHI